jgi:hypothetical protein
VKTGSTLALFQARVFLVDDINTALPTDDLAVRSAAFDGSANSHINLVKRVVCARNVETKMPSRAKAQEGEIIKSQRHGKRLLQLFFPSSLSFPSCTWERYCPPQELFLAKFHFALTKVGVIASGSAMELPQQARSQTPAEGGKFGNEEHVYR